MSSMNKKSPGAGSISRPSSRQAGRASLLKPVAQLKTGAPSQSIKRPVTPATRKPQPGAAPTKAPVAPAKKGLFPPGAGAPRTSATIQRNVPKGGAAQHNWDAKHVPQRVKQWAANAAVIVRQQYEITLANMAANPGNTGDGALGYMNNWFHKRFGGQYCLLYLWKQRSDGQGQYLAVQGVGKKNGVGNNYDLDD